MKGKLQATLLVQLLYTRSAGSRSWSSFLVPCSTCWAVHPHKQTEEQRILSSRPSGPGSQQRDRGSYLQSGSWAAHAKGASFPGLDVGAWHCLDGWEGDESLTVGCLHMVMIVFDQKSDPLRFCSPQNMWQSPAPWSLQITVNKRVIKWFSHTHFPAARYFSPS